MSAFCFCGSKLLVESLSRGLRQEYNSKTKLPDFCILQFLFYAKAEYSFLELKQTFHLSELKVCQKSYKIVITHHKSKYSRYIHEFLKEIHDDPEGNEYLEY